MAPEEIKIGTKIRMHTPNAIVGVVLCHVDAIIKHPIDDSASANMIVYRYWLKRKKRWVWQIEAYWALAMYNHWGNK